MKDNLPFPHRHQTASLIFLSIVVSVIVVADFFFFFSRLNSASEWGLETPNKSASSPVLSCDTYQTSVEVRSNEHVVWCLAHVGDYDWS